MDNDNNLPKPGIYRHFKGNAYHLLGFARHSETLEEMAVYRPLYGAGGLWVRPAAMWSETVEHNGHTQPRFAWLRKADGADPAGETSPADDDTPSTPIGGDAP